MLLLELEMTESHNWPQKPTDGGGGGSECD